MAEKNDLNIRSEEMQEIMQRIPSWVVRRGITVIFGLLLSGLFLTWLVKYPDIISGTSRLTTSVPPIKIISQTGGKITHLFVQDGQNVKAGQLLAEIENPLSINGINYIEGYLSNLNQAIESHDSKLPLPDTTGLALGDLQVVVNEIRRDITAYNLERTYNIDDAQISEIRQNISRQNELLKITLNMLDISKKELENASVKFESDAQLYKNGVISRQDYFQKQSEFNNKKIQYEQLKQTKLQYEVTINNLNLQLSQGIYTKDAKFQGNLESIKSNVKIIINYIHGWQQKYRLLAVSDGKLSYLNNYQINQFVKPGEEVFAVFQPNDSIIALAEIPIAGFGKVKTGQNVHLLLENYPDYDYGMLEGKVKKIALLPNSNFYRVEISIPKGMKSTQNKDLKFTPEMVALAEIITDDKTVMARIFKSILKVFDHQP